MDAKTAKLTAQPPINFRPGPLAEKITELQAEVTALGGKITPTEIVRDGLLACWDQVRSHLLVRHTTRPAASADVARLVAICSRAIEHGVTPDQIEATLTAQLEKGLLRSPATR